ncbi:MAG TPA: hypothetical protein VE868_01095, partial [Balneolaceae bacterium]|nr:hypothetical protein [Balneolaceae bacterium]
MASKTLLLFTVFFILNSGYGHAQSLNDHNSVFIDATTGVSVVHNSFTREFTPTRAIGLNVRLPFLKGQLEGGLRYTLYNGHAPTSVSSDFHTEFIYTGWSYPVNITSWYQIGPELRFGATRFSYNQSKVYRN